jgi:hypothetical protein
LKSSGGKHAFDDDGSIALGKHRSIPDRLDRRGRFAIVGPEETPDRSDCAHRSLFIVRGSPV